MKILILVVTLIEIVIRVYADPQTMQPSLQNDESKAKLSDNENQAKSVILKSVDDKKEYPKETQMAQCTVQSTDGLKVQAQATFSKKLDGICSTDDMTMLKENLRAMESRLYRDIYDLQLLIRKFLPKNEIYNEYVNYYPKSNAYPSTNFESNLPYQEPSNPYRPVEKNNPIIERTVKKSDTKTFIQNSNTPDFTTENLYSATTITTTENSRQIPKIVESNKLKSLETPRNLIKKTTTFTTTTETTPRIIAKNEYAYYWKLDNFPKLFQNSKKNEVFSHIFNVKGLSIRIRAALNLKEEETLLLDLEHIAGNTEKIEVGMSDGLVFQEIAEEKLFQYSFVILDQNNPNNIHVSPTYWNNDNENYLIPNIHLLKNFLRDNSLLIKLIITF